MDWEDFEHLCRELFERVFAKDGATVKVTQASRDQGVDAIIIDPRPIYGGKTVIQAKRYVNTVDVAAVRDLYGTVQHEGANKGILVTTSQFGPDAYNFIKGKNVELINGSELLYLLGEHGYKFKIDL
jgi:restriction system protein